MESLDWMKDIADGLAALTLQPHSFDLDGASWNVTTNGHVLVGVRGAPAFAAASAGTVRSLGKYLCLTVRGTPVPLTALRAFADLVDRVPCTVCHGDGSMDCGDCDGGGQDEDGDDCIVCDGDGTGDCHECDGKKTCWPIRPGRLLGELIDRTLLGRALAHLSDAASVEIAIVEPRMLLLRTADWTVTLMGLLPHEGMAPVVEFVDAVAHRDLLGRKVRAVWVRWARMQPAPKPSWLASYDDLSEADREADRMIGEALFEMGRASTSLPQQATESGEETTAHD